MKVFVTLSLTAVSLVGFTAPASAAKSTNPRPWFYAVEHSSPDVWHGFTCVIHAESRSTWTHPNLGDNNRYGSSGIFQIEDLTWLARSGFHFHVWQASPREQAIGALNIERQDGFEPWSSDGC